MTVKRLFVTWFWAWSLAVTVLAVEPIELDLSYPGDDSVPAGAKVELILPALVKLGETIPGILRVKNEGDREFKITTGGDYRGTGYPLRLKVRVTDSAGKVLPDAAKHGFNMGGISGFTTVLPKAHFDLTFPLEAYVELSEPGTYHVTAAHDFGWKVDPARPHPVAEGRFQVFAITAAEAEERVRALSAEKSDHPDWRIQLQWSRLTHPLYLPSLIAEAKAGNELAINALGAMPTREAAEVLLELLGHSATPVRIAAVRQLTQRFPLERRKLSRSYYAPNEDKDVMERFAQTYEAAADDAKLLSAAGVMLESSDTALVEMGAWLMEERGTPDNAPAVLAALQKAMDVYQKPRNTAESNILDAPSPANGLIWSLDALRREGWRTDGSGGTAIILAHFRQLADPNIPRPADSARWKQSVHAFISQNPPTLRMGALEAIPVQPRMEDEWVEPVMKALDDKDWGVIRIACEVAGKSGRKEFIKPLVQIVETIPHFFVQNAAHNAALALGVGSELWLAQCQMILVQDQMTSALSNLVVGTIELPKSNDGGGNSNFTRDQRFAIRDAWVGFIREN